MNAKKAKRIRRECSKAGVGKSGYRSVKKAYNDGRLAEFAKRVAEGKVTHGA